MNFEFHFGSHFIDFEKILEPILLHFNIVDYFFIDFDLHSGSYFIDFERILEPILPTHTPTHTNEPQAPNTVFALLENYNLI